MDGTVRSAGVRGKSFERVCRASGASRKHGAARNGADPGKLWLRGPDGRGRASPVAAFPFQRGRRSAFVLKNRLCAEEPCKASRFQLGEETFRARRGQGRASPFPGGGGEAASGSLSFCPVEPLAFWWSHPAGCGGRERILPGVAAREIPDKGEALFWTRWGSRRERLPGRMPSGRPASLLFPRLFSPRAEKGHRAYTEALVGITFFLRPENGQEGISSLKLTLFPRVEERRKRGRRA